MFETSMGELLLVFVIGLLILGPERLPRVAAQIGRWVAKARRTANQLRYQLEREVALEEIYKTQKKKPQKRPGSTAGTPGTEAPATDGAGSTEPDGTKGAHGSTTPAATADAQASDESGAAPAATEAAIGQPSAAPGSEGVASRASAREPATASAGADEDE